MHTWRLFHSPFSLYLLEVMSFKLKSDYFPCGDQPQVIEATMRTNSVNSTCPLLWIKSTLHST